MGNNNVVAKEKCPLCGNWYSDKSDGFFCFQCGYEKKNGYAIIGVCVIGTLWRDFQVDYYRFFPSLELAELHLEALENNITKNKPWNWMHLDVTIYKTSVETVKRKVYPIKTLKGRK